jgi:GNAT superfamily N-acetyltransferase
MDKSSLDLRVGSAADLDAINRVVEAAVMTWDLPERVKRLSLSSYRYQPHDLEHLELLVAEEADRGIVGVAAWEPADPRDAPPETRALLLHGLYVAPKRQRRGIGARVLEAAETAARAQGFDALLVKAQPSAEAFFRARGMERLPVLRPGRDYPHRFCKRLTNPLGRK